MPYMQYSLHTAEYFEKYQVTIKEGNMPTQKLMKLHFSSINIRTIKISWLFENCIEECLQEAIVALKALVT